MEQSNIAKLISNYGGKVWSIVSAFIFIPLYLSFLGNENYGLIGFYSLLLGVINFADSGISSAVIKELSQNTTSHYKYSVFRNLEKLYILICFTICLVIFFSSEFISSRWISAKEISNEKLVYYVKLIGVGVTTQLISSLYFGALFALNKQVKSNLMQIAWSFFKSAVVFLLFILFSKTIELYFIWQIICNLTYVLILRYFTIKELKKKTDDGKLNLLFKKLPLHVSKYIGGMVVIAVISAINIQADKLVTSSMFDLVTFGFYNIASNLAQIPVILAAPLMAFAFPLLTRYSNFEEQGNKDKSLVVFNKVFYLIVLIVISVSSGIFLYVDEILLLWTRQSIPSEIFAAISFDARALIIGSFFLAIQFPLFYLLLAKGKTRYTIFQGIIQVIIGVPLLYFFSKAYGLYGIPLLWIIINVGSFIYLFIIVSKQYLNFSNYTFYTQILLFPVLITILVNLCVYFVYNYIQINFIPFAILSSLSGLVLSVMYYNKVTNKPKLAFKHLFDFPNE